MQDMESVHMKTKGNMTIRLYQNIGFTSWIMNFVNYIILPNKNQ